MTILVLTLHCICHGFGKINTYGICLTHHRQIPVIMFLFTDGIENNGFYFNLCP